MWSSSLIQRRLSCLHLRRLPDLVIMIHGHIQDGFLIFHLLRSTKLRIYEQGLGTLLQPDALKTLKPTYPLMILLQPDAPKPLNHTTPTLMLRSSEVAVMKCDEEAGVYEKYEHSENNRVRVLSSLRAVLVDVLVIAQNLEVRKEYS